MAVNPKEEGTNNKYQVHYLAYWNTKFVSGASLIFVSGTKSGNYHDLINGENFEHWMLTQLLPNLEEPLVLVMDNAHHSILLDKPPTQLEKG
jgi:hypothetical protein